MTVAAVALIVLGAVGVAAGYDDPENFGATLVGTLLIVVGVLLL